VKLVDGHFPHPYKRGARPASLFTDRTVVSPICTFDKMANTKSAKKAARQIARRTVINKGRRSRVRTAVRKVEEAIVAGDRAAALAAMADAEPAIIRGAQKGVVHRNAARRKVSRLVHRIAKLGK
jgi:small subunit ribosomal protein S20